jgi:predicted ribosomally synthesized peptide with SipW-like signal peptide
MTNTKNTKRALLSSVMALFLCFAMLLGTTYAWFTDSVTSANNVIQSGNLDVVLEYKSNWSDDWATVDENTKIFKEGALYEPGYTEVVYLRISNTGSLALKYLLSFNLANEEGSINVYGDEFKLSDYLQIGYYVQDEYSSGFNYADILMPNMFGTRKAALNSVELQKLSEANAVISENAPILPGDDTAQVVAIVLAMPDTVGNEANTRLGEDAPYIELGVRLFATQYTHENDSFGNQYDANVDQPTVHEIHNAADFTKAFAEGGQAIIENMDLSGENAVYGELAAGKSLALNTNNSMVAKKDDESYAIVNYGDLEITGNGTITTRFKGSIENWGKLYVNNLNIDVKGDKYGFHVKAGEAELNDLVLNAERGGVNIQGGKVTINSGSYKFSGYYDNVNKKWINGQSVYAVGEDVEVVINGGDFRFTGGIGGNQRILVAQNGAKIIVNDGTFGKGNNKAAATWLWEYGGDIIIYGGSFEFDPSACVAEGYQAVQGVDGWWTVSKIAG